jgi:hypothetical protein
MVFEKDGKRKSFPKGFSWTVFFFGFWVPIFRRDPRHTVLFLIFYGSGAGLLLALQTEPLREMLFYGYLAAACYVAWNYNRWYAAQLRREGYHEVETLSPPDELTVG